MVLKERGESAGMVWPPVWAVTHARVGGSPMERTERPAPPAVTHARVLGALPWRSAQVPAGPGTVDRGRSRGGPRRAQPPPGCGEVVRGRTNERPTSSARSSAPHVCDRTTVDPGGTRDARRRRASPAHCVALSPPAAIQPAPSPYLVQHEGVLAASPHSITIVVTEITMACSLSVSRAPVVSRAAAFSQRSVLHSRAAVYESGGLPADRRVEAPVGSVLVVHR